MNRKAKGIDEAKAEAIKTVADELRRALEELGHVRA
jgi:hypothetical protein